MIFISLAKVYFLISSFPLLITYLRNAIGTRQAKPRSRGGISGYPTIIYTKDPQEGEIFLIYIPPSQIYSFKTIIKKSSVIIVTGSPVEPLLDIFMGRSKGIRESVLVGVPLTCR